MKKMKLLLLLLVCLVGMLPTAFSQSATVSGKVVSGANLPLSGATVTVKGTNTATVTNEAGVFTVTVPSVPGTLVISYAGMTPVERTVTGATNLNITLQENMASLDEVVVVGYGTQRVTKVSGSISTVKAADIEKLVPTRAEEAIQGRAPGVNVIQGGSPGSAPTVLIRGIPSNVGNSPIVIVDGMPQTLTDLNSINPADIESITVLKDAATTAIYGVSGGNGVILVTTKTGRRNGRTEIMVNNNYGRQEVMRTIGVLNATEYAAMINEGSTVSGGPVIFPDLTKLGVGTNWQNEVFKPAPFQSHNVSVRSGSEKSSYFLSAGYLRQGGIVGGIDKSVFSRGNFTANLDFYLSNKVKFIVNATGVLLSGRGVQENSFNSIIGSAINYDPTVPVLNNTNTVGKYGFSSLILSEVFNPLTKLDNTYNKNTGSKIYGKFELQYEVLRNLKLTSRFGYTKYDGNARSFNPLVFYGINNVDNSMNADGSTVPGRFNSVAHEKTSNFNYTWETFGNYDFKVGKHNFETVLGFSLASLTGNAAGATRQDVPFNSWEFADFTAATGQNTSTNPNALGGYYYQYFRRNASGFGRINYDYDGRFLASFSARRDGSIAFGPENKFAGFYAGSLGWVVNREKFFKSNLINLLKLRGSYGTTGTEKVDPALVRIVTGGPSYGPTGNSNGYNFNNVFYPGSTVASAANEELGWETNLQANIGFDLGLANNRFTITADYFQRSVSGLLFEPRLPLYLGTIQPPPANIGTTESSGFELTLGYTETIAKSLRLNTVFTFTHAKNLVTSTNDDGTARILGGYYFNGQSQSVTVFEKGFAPGYFYGFKTQGLFQSQEEIAKAPTQQGAQPGDIRFADINGDGVITAADQTEIGNPFPDFTAGWTLNLNYKNFDFTAFTYASVGNDIYRAYERNANYTNKDRSVLARWTGAGSTNDARYPRYSFIDANSNIRVSDRYVEDGSFVKIKNIQLGYNFPKSLLGRVFSNARLYVQVKNLYTFTKYSGFDPEIPGGVLDTGIDRGAYPQPRTYAIGLDFKL
jgi:TonB-dependent starch-binding outer membrane protein SusC